MRLFWADARRLVGRPRFWLVSVGVLAFSLQNVYRYYAAFRTDQVFTWHDVLYYAISPVQILLPLVVGATVGTSVAEDRKNGFVRLLMVRGVSRRMYVTARFASATSANALALGGTLLVAGAFARALSPAVGSAGPPYTGILGSDVGFIVTTAAVMVLGAAFYVGAGVALGLLTTNAFLVVAMVFAVHLVPSVILGGSQIALSPIENLEVRAGGTSLLVIGAYWSIGVLAALVASHVIVRARESM